MSLTDPPPTPPVIPDTVASPPANGLPKRGRLRQLLLGRPKDLRDRRIFHQLSLVPLLAWVGLGADGLSSSAYGPEEAFRALGEHTYIAVVLAVAVVATVWILSLAYSRIIEEFPHGGGGYVVASKLLGENAGLISGAALLIDYVLTITVSIAAAGDALFSLLPEAWLGYKLYLEMAGILCLTTINLRGVRESVLVLAPVFLTFVVTHAVLIAGGIIGHVDVAADTAREVTEGFRQGLSSLGLLGVVLLFIHAYSLGGGTYTGIEAVSNSLQIMRPPQVQTARRTMLYMAVSLSIAAAGLLVCYLLWEVRPTTGRTMNALLVQAVAADKPLGGVFIWLTLLSEGAILVVAAQAGFIAGPRVLANMALDGWAPRRFAALSERLTIQDGIGLVGLAALATLVYTGGSIHQLVVMYSINVFLTFLLSMLGMTRLFWSERRRRRHWKRRLALFLTGLVMCTTILVITVTQKFTEGGWVTLIVTGTVIVLFWLIRGHYRKVGRQLARLYQEVGRFPDMLPDAPPPPFDPEGPTAAILVGGYSGLGIHTTLTIARRFPGYFRNMVFISVGVVDAGEFKGEGAVAGLAERLERELKQYVDMARKMGFAADYRYSIGTDVVDEAEKICLEVETTFPRTMFFSGKLIFERDSWFNRMLHNDTALAVEKRLHRAGQTMVILPARLT